MEIIVQGKGTEIFTPNEVILNIGFNTKGQSYEEVLSEGVKNVQKFVNELLLQNGFTTDDMKTRNFVVREEQKYDEATRTYLFDGFSFNQNATLKFDYSKEKIARIMEDLSKLDNAPSCHINFGVKDAKECKRKILSKAYKEAELQAQAIAEAAGKSLKQCVKVDFKPFTTDYVSQTNFDSDMMYDKGARLGAAPAIINTFTPEDIELSETLYCLWITE
jgi:uncharacterized protein YggE